jgi:hypothetical protein
MATGNAEPRPPELTARAVVASAFSPTLPCLSLRHRDGRGHSRDAPFGRPRDVEGAVAACVGRRERRCELVFFATESRGSMVVRAATFPKARPYPSPKRIVEDASRAQHPARLRV